MPDYTYLLSQVSIFLNITDTTIVWAKLILNHFSKGMLQKYLGSLSFLFGS